MASVCKNVAPLRRYETNAGNVSRATDDHAGDVVVLWRGADEIIEIAHDVGESHGGALGACGFGYGKQTRVAEGGMVFVPSFGNAVGVDDQEVLRIEARQASGIDFGELDAERHIVGLQAFDGAAGAPKNRGIVAGAQKCEIAGGGIQF